jgi:hypothetical protein
MIAVEGGNYICENSKVAVGDGPVLVVVSPDIKRPA